ncbi:hypothetical protein [Faecalispora jeddahensis]|uniref:hypothetical protein n=1 Tax=Faecalispora jeddahensis TaxID=1414721 RepID=UPI00145BE3BC|nr:hypothetical protein [Faecalispora jeddahensis]
MKKPLTFSLCPRRRKKPLFFHKESHLSSELTAIKMGARQTMEAQKKQTSTARNGTEKARGTTQIAQTAPLKPFNAGNVRILHPAAAGGACCPLFARVFQPNRHCAGGTLSLLQNTKTASFPYTPFFYQNRFYYTPEFQPLSIGF